MTFIYVFTIPMNPFRSSSPIICAAASMLMFFTGCASPVNKFVAYRPPGKSINLGIEVISIPQVPPIFELKIDGQHVMELPWSMFNYHRSATGTYNGKPVKMMGRFVPGGTFYIDVFIDNDRSANFTFP